MTDVAHLSLDQLERVRAAAVILLAGSMESAAPEDLPDFEELLQLAAGALHGEGRALAAAIDAIPLEPTWEGLSALADHEPSSFQLVSLLAVGAYFMSPSVLASLGIPAGKRRAANPEQVVDELGTGLLDPVFERGCPIRTLDDVNGVAHAI